MMQTTQTTWMTINRRMWWSTMVHTPYNP